MLEKDKWLIVACKTLEDEIKAVNKENIDCIMLEYALHRVPDALRKELIKTIEGSEGYSTILFGYGLCSNGVANLGSHWHTCVVPKVHDCISILLGSRDLYDKEFAEHPATYYLSKGWIDQAAGPLDNYKEYLEKYDEKTAKWLIESQYANYKRVVFIHTVPSADKYLEHAREVADFLNAKFEEREGSLDLLKKLMSGQWQREFVVTPPGQMILPRSFL